MRHKSTIVLLSTLSTFKGEETGKRREKKRKEGGLPNGRELDVPVSSGRTGGHGVFYAGESCFSGASAGSLHSCVWWDNCHFGHYLCFDSLIDSHTNLRLASNSLIDYNNHSNWPLLLVMVDAIMDCCDCIWLITSVLLNYSC